MVPDPVPGPRPRPDPGPAPGGAACWRTVAALSVIAVAVQGCTLMTLAVLMPAIAADFGGRAGWAPTILMIAMSAANMPVGWALTRIDPRGVLAAGMAMALAGWLGAGMAHSRWALAAGMMLTGAGVAASTIVPGIAVITRDVRQGRGMALGIYLGATVLAGAIAPFLIGLAVPTVGWRGAMMLGALAMATTMPLVLKVPHGRATGTPAQEDGDRRAAPLRWQGAALRAILAMTMIQFSINGILFAAVDTLLRQGLTQAQAIGAFSLANLMGLPALAAGGWVADRMGGRSALIQACILLSAGSIALLAAGPFGMAGVAAFVLLWGVASALPGQAGSMLIADIAPRGGFPRLLGVATAVSGLIGALAPVVTDALAGAGGSVGRAALLYAMLALGAAPLVASVRPSPGSSPNPLPKIGKRPYMRP